MIGLIAAGVGACGGGDGSNSTTSTASELTKSQLVAQGDAICKDAHDRFAELQGSPPTTPEESASFTQKLIDITESEVTQLRGLNPPASVKPALDSYLKSLDKNRMTCARSSGFGHVLKSASGIACRFAGVSMMLGRMEFTRTPVPLASAARESMSATAAALDAAYAPAPAP
jgi:hypothetical protein